MSQNQSEYDKHIGAFFREIDALFAGPLETVAQLSFALAEQSHFLPYWEFCSAFRGIPYWGGGGGSSGYSFSGSFHAHPKREPRYHTKEVVLDSISVGNMMGSSFGPLIETKRDRVPFGRGGARGIVLFLGESQADMKKAVDRMVISLVGERSSPTVLLGAARRPWRRSGC